MSRNRLTATAASAAWAAWGDALGFITELTDSSGLRYRAGVDQVSVPVKWRRKIGGRAGATIDLPAGSYSDDTQLRLATSRCIRGDGEFDVDSFSRIELVAWQAYHLGAGRGSKAAAAAMARSGARWNQNTFSSRGQRYVDVGGNGAAMRIQPHVWAARDLVDPITLLRNVLRDAVCTHGHPVGLVGAAFHALTLAKTMQEGQTPTPGQWPKLAASLEVLPEVIATDDELGGLWLPAWEQAAGHELIPAIETTIRQVQGLITKVRSCLSSKHADADAEYVAVLNAVGGFDDTTRGSGTGTSMAALYLAATAEDPVASLARAANALGSDTDTIGTMAGALMGAVLCSPPDSRVQDYSYLMDEAARLHTIARGAAAPSYSYPDLLRWNPPRSALDLVGTDADGRLSLAGLGPVETQHPPVVGAREGTVYQWGELRTGQRILLRLREDPKPLSTNLLASKDRWQQTPSSPGDHASQCSLLQEQEPSPTPPSPASNDKDQARQSQGTHQSLDVDTALRRVRERDHAAHAVGQSLLDLIRADPDRAVERAAAFSAAIARDLQKPSHSRD